MSELNRDRLAKIIALAKGGVGGEKDNAIRMVKKICAEHALDFDDVMNSIEVKEYQIEYSNVLEHRVLSGCIFKYGLMKYSDKIMINEKMKHLMFTTTLDKYIDVVNAFSVLRGVFKVEKKIAEEAFLKAFRDKHELFYNPTEEEWKKINEDREKETKKKTAKEIQEEIQRDSMAMGIKRALNDADIHKQIGTSKK